MCQYDCHIVLWLILTPHENQMHPKIRGSETVWLNAAYDMLTTFGVEVVKVMPLANKLGLSRTSFYWHFKDRDELLAAMTRFWEDKNTGNLVQQTEAYAESISEAMFNVFDCWLSKDLFDSQLDLAIRNWARNDPALQETLNKADTRRQIALRAMFLRFGYDEVQAEVRSMIVIYTQIGYILMQVREPLAKRIDAMPDYVEVFTGQRPTQSDINRFRARHLKF